MVQPYAVGAVTAEPISADHRDDNVSLQQCLLYMTAKIGSDRDAIDIHENRFFAVLRGQAIENAPGNGGGVGAPV